MALFAMVTLYPNVAQWAAYMPAWWACTFPSSTVSMGGRQVALVNGSQRLDAIALTVPVLPITHWALCSTRFVSWVLEVRKNGAGKPAD